MNLTHPGWGPVVIRFGALGDMIRLTALLRLLAQRWRSPCSVVGDHPAAGEALEGLATVAEVFHFGARRYPFLLSPQQWRLLSWLRRRRGSPVYVIEERRHRRVPWSDRTRVEWLLERAGFPGSELVTLADCPRGPLEHAVDHLLRLGYLDPPALPAPHGAPVPAPRPELAISAGELLDVRRWLTGRGWDGEPVILLQTRARRDHRGLWPDARWQEVARELRRKRPDALILYIGSARERRAVAPLAAAAADPRVQTAARDLPLRRLFALLTLAHSMISLDTGPAHAAAALGCPVVVLVGRADPRRHRPVGAPGRVELVAGLVPDEVPTAVDWWDRSDLGDVAVAHVLAAWERLAAVEGTAAGRTAPVDGATR